MCMLSPCSHVWLFVTLWTVACQIPLSMGFSRQEYWSGLPWSPPGHLLNPGIKPSSLMCPALADGFFTNSATWEAPRCTKSAYIVELLSSKGTILRFEYFQIRGPQPKINSNFAKVGESWTFRLIFRGKCKQTI